MKSIPTNMASRLLPMSPTFHQVLQHITVTIIITIVKWVLSKCCPWTCAPWERCSPLFLVNIITRGAPVRVQLCWQTTICSPRSFYCSKMCVKSKSTTFSYYEYHPQRWVFSCVDRQLFVWWLVVAAGMTSTHQCQWDSRRDHPDSVTPAELPVAEDIVSLYGNQPSTLPLCVCVGSHGQTYMASYEERPGAFVGGTGRPVNREDSHQAKMVWAENFRLPWAQT